MPNSRELMRVGLPTRAVRLRNLLAALDLDDVMEEGREATVRYSRGQLVIDAPEATFPEPGLDGDGDGDETRDSKGDGDKAEQ